MDHGLQTSLTGALCGFASRVNMRRAISWLNEAQSDVVVADAATGNDALMTSEIATAPSANSIAKGIGGVVSSIM